MLKLITSGIALAAFLTPALAAEYWVVFDPSTQRCSVVEKKSQQTAAEATEAAGPDQSEAAATNSAAGGGRNNSPENETNMTNRTTADIHLEVVAPNNSQETAPSNPQETATDNSQDTAPNNSHEIETDKTERTENRRGSATQAQTPTDTDNLLRLLAEAAESSKNGEKTFIGSGFPTRAEAEYRMTIMRKCGIAK